MWTVFLTFSAVVSLSGLTIAGCAAFRQYLLPDTNAAYLTVERMMDDGSSSCNTYMLHFGEETELQQTFWEEVTEEVIPDEEYHSEGQRIQRKTIHRPLTDAVYSIQKIESSYDTLTPKRKLAYRLCGVAMVAVPAVLSIGGILFCGFYFYRKRLVLPLRLLEEATEQIGAQNLDFVLEYDRGDELGALCRSFELMREELADNHKAMWKMLEQRRLMQASIAHDLRNPIAIIRGYTEYLQINLPDGKISRKKAERIAGNLNLAAKRLEKYTESVRALNQLEDMEINRSRISAAKWMEDIREDLQIMAAGADKTLLLENDLQEGSLLADSTVLYRILENVFENAFRFARNTVYADFSLQEQKLRITVRDDGDGFSEEFLHKGIESFPISYSFQHGGQEGHLGVGLTISRILCGKHGGNLQMGNASPHGGVVKIILTV